MREYRIKRGHNPDINTLVSRYFNAKGDIENGMQFSVDGIGTIAMRQEKNLLIVDITPPQKVSNDYSIIRKWNEFLLDATGMDTKERKKLFGKI